MTRYELIDTLGALIAGLQAPFSLQVPLGAAYEPLSLLFQELNSFGYPTAEQYADRLHGRLDQGPTT